MDYMIEGMCDVLAAVIFMYPIIAAVMRILTITMI